MSYADRRREEVSSNATFLDEGPPRSDLDYSLLSTSSGESSFSSRFWFGTSRAFETGEERHSILPEVYLNLCLFYSTVPLLYVPG